MQPRATSLGIDGMEEKISNGQRTLRRMRWKLFFAVQAVVFLQQVVYAYFRYVKTEFSIVDPCDSTLSAYARISAMAVLYYGRLTLLGLALMYDDLLTMRVVMAQDIAFQLWYVLCFTGNWSSMGVGAWNLGVWYFPDAYLFYGFLRAACDTDLERMRARMWRTLHVWCWMYVAVDTVLATRASITCGFFSVWWIVILLKLLMVLFITRPDLRERYHTALVNFVVGRSQERAAAAVAALVGRCSVKYVTDKAAARFRTIELGALSFEELADNAPDPELFARSSSASRHDCDAFVSHSWHDDSAAKWAALQCWREAFIKENGREPRVWFDKCCIDQNNITADLQCLPVFLSSCRRLVVFCGPSYLSRLWCIMELFTFVQIGRCVESMEFRVVLRDGQEEEDLASIETAFANFDAKACTCFDQKDKERMLSIIHTAFGSMEDFNEVVRLIFRKAQWQDMCSRQRSVRKEGSEAAGGMSSCDTVDTAADTTADTTADIVSTTSGTTAGAEELEAEGRGFERGPNAV